jgi:enterochelin esterase-like enzyme
MSRLRPDIDWPSGEVVRLPHVSRVLADNPWGDPVEREVTVYLPHGYCESGEPYPALWDLAAYTNAGPGHVNWRNHGENLPARLDRLIGTGEMDPVVVVFPDCYTSLGGNQYVNSPAVGRYADYLLDELLPFVSGRFNVIDEAGGRATFGKSSGGFGGLHLALRHPGHFGAVASHAGDVGFELVYRGEFPAACGVLAAWSGDHRAFMKAFWRRNKLSGRDFTAMMILAMAASYDPDPDDPASIRLPFDLRTCALDEERWQQWLAYDPLTEIETKSDALRALKGLYLDVGIHDQYHIQYGSRRLSDRLRALQVPHHYEEFEGTHSSIDWRLDFSLPFLVRALKSGAPATT